MMRLRGQHDAQRPFEILPGTSCGSPIPASQAWPRGEIMMPRKSCCCLGTHCPLRSENLICKRCRELRQLPMKQ